MNIRAFNKTTPNLAEGVYVDDTALVIGDVKIGPDSSVWPMTVIRGDVHYIRIGSGTNIQDHSVLHVSHDSEFEPGGHPLEIGNNVTIGHQTVLHGCTVGNNCMIGMGSMVMDGAVIQKEVILGAGSLVTPNKTLESGYLWMGRPAKKVRALTAQEKEQLEYSARHYMKLKNDYLESNR
ncbi:MAG: gamma carbonic anhydrase family protein [Gammaproteobacteria bacterium]|nr:gamma carbonic anhydrase family protein [Gammaproteobacteria bacterium]